MFNSEPSLDLTCDSNPAVAALLSKGSGLAIPYHTVDPWYQPALLFFALCHPSPVFLILAKMVASSTYMVSIIQRRRGKIQKAMARDRWHFSFPITRPSRLLITSPGTSPSNYMTFSRHQNLGNPGVRQTYHCP